MAPDTSVIIRVRDEQANLDRCLRTLADQQLPDRTVEVIVVDCCSSDRSVAVATAHGASVIELPPARFTFGGALNLGAESAHGTVLVSLSAHAFPGDRGWLQRITTAVRDNERVACATGDRYDPDGAPLTRAVHQDLALARRRPEWGYSNAAGAFRADLWRRRPFRAELPGCEDKEWAWHWLSQGLTCLIDPSLAVDHDHTHDKLASIYRRARREAAGYAAFAQLAPYGPRELLRDWWTDLRWYDSPARARLSHRRAARLFGAYVGRRTHTPRCAAT